jgi:predicted nuclease of predicted toxin-antitoxin system
LKTDKRELIRFLADVNIERIVVDHLSNQGYDVKWIPDYECDMLDCDLFNLASREKRILLTNDKDFGELAFLQKKARTGIILMRIKGQNPLKKIEMLDKLLLTYSDKLKGHLTVVRRAKIRIIPMEGIE